MITFTLLWTSSQRVASGRIERDRARLLGASAVAVLVALVGVVFVVGLSGWLHAIPAGVVSFTLVAAIGLAAHAGLREWRSTPAPASFDPRLSRHLPTGMALLIGLPGVWISALVQSFDNTASPGCPPVIFDDGGSHSRAEAALLERCQQTTPAEVAGLVTWVIVIVATAVFLTGTAVMAKRSRVARWVAVPTAIAGCVVAPDLARVVAMIVR
jgi:hypothetical protein